MTATPPLATTSSVCNSVSTEATSSLVFRPSNIVDRFRWEEIFQKAQPIEVELGSGDGSFLAKWAEQNPTINFLGVERLFGRLKKLDRKGQRLRLTNLRLLRFEAAYLLQYLLPARSIRALHVYFPDPWPKRRHQDRRLINEAFTRQAQALLELGGCVWLRTDDEDYFRQMTEVFAAASDRFESIEASESMIQVTTDFEREFNARGIPTRRAGYRVRS